jgi:tetratricopeptide (TPR) repeat protein
MEEPFMPSSTTRFATSILIPAVALTLSCSWLGVDSGSDTPGMPRLLEQLGEHRLPIQTESELAQRYFDQGLALTYGFNHAAAVAAFDAAITADPTCAACYWGKANALGPNINAPMGPDAARAAYAAIALATQHKATASPRLQALIEAQSERYVAEPPEDRTALDAAYAEAMRRVQAQFPNDTDIATLTAEALMDLYPWNYWDDEGEPREHTDEIVGLLEWVIEAEPTHLGANHYYIHAVEEFFPAKAEPAADRLGTLAPDAGHLVHMPSHIYWRVGRYADATDINKRAAAADEQFFAWCRPGTFYRALYYPHNIHFLWAAASTEGQSETALTAARKLAQQVESLHSEFPLVEEFLAVPHQTLVRFGRWDAALGEPKPPEGRPYQLGIWNYARGVAQARTGKLDEAAASLAELQRIGALPETEALMLAGGISNGKLLLAIGAQHLEGELASARGDTKAAIAALEEAVEQQDALGYMEPPPWYFPVRQTLGAVQLEAGRAKDAEASYRADLDQYPKNGWSLLGLAQSLEAQGRDGEADWARQGHANAWARADVKLESSRF